MQKIKIIIKEKYYTSVFVILEIVNYITPFLEQAGFERDIPYGLIQLHYKSDDDNSLAHLMLICPTKYNGIEFEFFIR